MKQDHQSNLETHNNLSHDKSQAVFNKELLIGKNYRFYSASGSNILSLTNSKIRSEVCIGEDRIGFIFQLYQRSLIKCRRYCYKT